MADHTVSGPVMYDTSHSLLWASVAAVPCAVVPPGFYVSNGGTVPCPSNSFRADWVAAFQAGSCESCGEGVQLDKTEKIAVFDITTGAQTLLAVATSSEDCCKCWELRQGGVLVRAVVKWCRWISQRTYLALLLQRRHSVLALVAASEG